jgi:hypothetical protein
MCTFTTTAAAILLAAPCAYAQLQIDWYTIDGGGGTSSGGSISITGTIGQPDAATSAGGGIECAGGFWGAFAGATCYANCDGSNAAPILNVSDFICFLNRFAAGDGYANCDGSTAPPILNVSDFICFLNRFAAGCP